jgi:heme d1 biosynthesis radical SAM protein NirJ
VPVLVLSGGEPLLRPDIFAVSRRAKALGFAVALSSNGTLIDERVADEIAAVGYDYVGISLDGIGPVHDSFRRREGAYQAALAGLRLCRERGTKVGVRFTMTEGTVASLPALLDLIEEERIGRFYLSHLVYAGRGHRYRRDDARHRTTRRALALVFERCHDSVLRGEDREFVTGNNDADGVYFLHWVRERFPAEADRLRAKLVAWGGNASGVNVANIDNLGNVHPDTYWSHHNLGNVRERPFSAIWRDSSDPVLAGLRARPRRIGGRCASCRHFDICAGNTRIRALRTSGNPWTEDPACYLTDQEIGVAQAVADAPGG